MRDLMSICPGCGRPSKEGLCSQCILDSAQVLSCPNKVQVTVCSVCGSVFEHGRWASSELSLSELMEKAVLEAVSTHEDLQERAVEVRLLERGATRYAAFVDVTGRLAGLEAKGSCSLEVRLSRQACDKCSRIAGKYFEGVVQIRRSVEQPMKEDLEAVKRAAYSMAESGRRRDDPLSFIQDIEDVKGGIDIIVGSSQLGRRISKYVLQQFGGSTTESAKLVGCKDGRDLYRTTFLVRMPRLRKGDFVLTGAGILEVTGFDGSRTTASSSINGIRAVLSEEESSKAELLGSRSNAKSSVAISVDENAVEILDPETFQTAIAIRPPNRDIVPGQDVSVLRTRLGLILL